MDIGAQLSEGQANVYGTIVSLGDVTYSVDRVKLVVPEPGRSEFVSGRSETAAATIEALPESEMTITISRATEAGASHPEGPKP